MQNLNDSSQHAPTSYQTAFLLGGIFRHLISTGRRLNGFGDEGGGTCELSLFAGRLLATIVDIVHSLGRKRNTLIAISPLLSCPAKRDCICERALIMPSCASHYCLPPATIVVVRDPWIANSFSLFLFILFIYYYYYF